MDFNPKDFFFNGFSGVDMRIDHVKIRALAVKNSRLDILAFEDDNPGVELVSYLEDGSGWLEVVARMIDEELRLTIEFSGLTYYAEDHWKGTVDSVIPWRPTNARR